MRKSVAWLLSVTAVVWMTATAITLEYNGWLALLFFVLCCCTIGFGFAVKSRSRRNPR
ncbi:MULTISPECIES: DUF5325 family protein [Cohnella]|uniref:DUF5325 family protein n=1 Tax=Cohnella TaxID=329857 RepID=UPI0003A45046|nr:MULTISPECIES: DUF5325 family protein [Cohnella]